MSTLARSSGRLAVSSRPPMAQAMDGPLRDGALNVDQVDRPSRVLGTILRPDAKECLYEAAIPRCDRVIVRQQEPPSNSRQLLRSRRSFPRRPQRRSRQRPSRSFRRAGLPPWPRRPGPRYDARPRDPRSRRRRARSRHSDRRHRWPPTTQGMSEGRAEGPAARLR